MLAHNLNRDVREVRLFERGTVFTAIADDAGAARIVVERPGLTLGLTGASTASALYSAGDAPFYELKGALESLLSLVAHDGVRFTGEAPKWLEAGRCATALIGERPIARFGELAASERAVRKLRQPVFLAEIDLALLYTLPLKKVAARELSRFQAVDRDFSVVFPDATPWVEIEATIKGIAIAELTRLTPVEIFRDAKGKSISAGHYALLLRCVFQSRERTLREDELTAWSNLIVGALAKLGGVLRDGHGGSS